MLELIPHSPLFWACVIASIVGLAVHFLYRGFIEENHRKIKWFRRLLLPHLTPLLNEVDDETEVDLSKLYVETSVSEAEHVIDIDTSDSHWELELEMLSDYLIERGWRPEVLLASLASDPQGRKEVGNFVLTAPEREHPDVVFLSSIYEVILMFFSEWQLHVRIYHNEEEEKLQLYAHHEKNAYSPFHAEDHFNGEGMDVGKGRHLFHDEMKNYNINYEEVYGVGDD